MVRPFSVLTTQEVREYVRDERCAPGSRHRMARKRRITAAWKRRITAALRGDRRGHGAQGLRSAAVGRTSRAPPRPSLGRGPAPGAAPGGGGRRGPARRRRRVPALRARRRAHPPQRQPGGHGLRPDGGRAAPARPAQLPGHLAGRCRRARTPGGLPPARPAEPHPDPRGPHRRPRARGLGEPGAVAAVALGAVPGAAGQDQRPAATARRQFADHAEGPSRTARRTAGRLGLGRGSPPPSACRGAVRSGPDGIGRRPGGRPSLRRLPAVLRRRDARHDRVHRGLHRGHGRSSAGATRGGHRGFPGPAPERPRSRRRARTGGPAALHPAAEPGHRRDRGRAEPGSAAPAPGQGTGRARGHSRRDRQVRAEHARSAACAGACRRRVRRPGQHRRIGGGAGGRPRAAGCHARGRARGHRGDPLTVQDRPRPPRAR
jgi:hypothetical protein